MPEYLSPGVYIEELPGPQPIQGVSTSTTGMVGVTLKGPTLGKPRLVTSLNEFNQIFGGFIDEPIDEVERARWELNDREGGYWWRFPLAVKGFFDNGGRRLFVKRVVSGQAQASEASIPTNAVQDRPAGVMTDPLRLVAATATPPPPALLRAVAKAEGGWGDDIKVRVTPGRARRLQAVFPPTAGAPSGPLGTTLAADIDKPATPTTATTASVAWPARLGTVVGPVVVEIAGERFQVNTVPAPPTGGQTAVQLQLPSGPSARRLRGTPVKIFRLAAPASGATRDVLVASPGGDAVYPGAMVLVGPTEARATASSITTVPQPGDIPDLTRLQLTPVTPGSFPAVFESDVVAVIEAVVEVRYEEGVSNPLVERDEPVVLEERFPGLRLDNLTGTSNSIVDFVNAESDLIRLEVVPQPPPPPPQVTVGWAVFPGGRSDDDRGWTPLVGGNDALQSLQPADFVGVDGGPGRRTGIVALEDIEEISICAVPGMWSRTVQSALIGHCERLKDRFAILDAQRGLGVQEVLTFRSSLDSRYAALYHPWLKVLDPLTNKDVVVPPAGHMAGLYAFVDNDRGVHKAPANVVVQQIAGLDDDINTREQDFLNPVGINALREFPFRGFRVWGARTISSVPEWRYVNVRRLFIFIEDSIKQGTQWVVFEPNAEPLWAQVTQAVTNFLDTVWRSGALEGVKQEEAFFVRCDRTTMTEDDIANGRLIVLIGIAPVKPAEFVIFRFKQKTREEVAVA
jgi:phage tail sheath protein FI